MVPSPEQNEPTEQAIQSVLAFSFEPDKFVWYPEGQTLQLLAPEPAENKLLDPQLTQTELPRVLWYCPGGHFAIILDPSHLLPTGQCWHLFLVLRVFPDV